MSNDTHLRLLLQLPASDTRSTASKESSIVPLPQLEDTSTARSGLIRHTTPITHNRRRKRSTGDLRGEDRVRGRLHAGSSRFSHPSGCRSHSTTMASLRSRMRSSGLLVNTGLSLVWTGHHISWQISRAVGRNGTLGSARGGLYPAGNQAELACYVMLE